MTEIYSLICEDASGLGISMATDHTDFMWMKLFSTRDKAKAYAEKYSKSPKDEIRWKGNSWDARCYIFTIKKEKVL